MLLEKNFICKKINDKLYINYSANDSVGLKALHPLSSDIIFAKSASSKIGFAIRYIPGAFLSITSFSVLFAIVNGIPNASFNPDAVRTSS